MKVTKRYSKRRIYVSKIYIERDFIYMSKEM